MKSQPIKISNLIKISILILVFLLVHAVVSYLYIRQSTLAEVNKRLSVLATSIEKNIRYSNGRFDMSRYNSDPSTPSLHGSGGYVNPLYIITRDGYVIERTRPIDGLLDSADFDYPRDFSTPKSVDTVTNEQWRLYSKPVTIAPSEIATIVVATSLSESQLPFTDEKLASNAAIIANTISTKNALLDTSTIDVRSIDYDVSFEIIDQYNKVLMAKGRLPTYIDRSYVAAELERVPSDRIVKENSTGIHFYVVTRQIADSQGKALALVTLAEPVNNLNDRLNAYLTSALIYSLFVMFPFAWLLLEFVNRQVETTIQLRELRGREMPVMNIISFDKKSSVIRIDERTVVIPYSSNQYYLCVSMFTHPKKRWEHDELTEKFGDIESEESWRKVYDAHLAINRKVGFKLIEYKDKLFRFNPEYLPKLV